VDGYALQVRVGHQRKCFGRISGYMGRVGIQVGNGSGLARGTGSGHRGGVAAARAAACAPNAAFRQACMLACPTTHARNVASASRGRRSSG